MFGRRLLKAGALAKQQSRRHRSFSFSSSSSQSADPCLQPSASASASYQPPRLSWIASFLKFGFFTTVAAATGASAYATYAYTLEELDNKIKRMRECRTPNVKDDASTFEKLQDSFFSAAMTVSSKSIEQYAHMRKSVEDKFWDYAVFLPPLPYHSNGQTYTLVLDLDETLVYSDYNPERGWKTFKRPGVDAFLDRVGQLYEVIVYTDQPSEYAESVVRRLNNENPRITYALGKPTTKYEDGKRYRDLSKLNRDPAKVIYVSGHEGTTFQPENSILVKAWKLEPNDKSLSNLLPFLEYVGMHKPDDIRTTLETYRDQDIPSEFKRRLQGKNGGIWRK